jgi:hypothetical protein
MVGKQTAGQGVGPGESAAGGVISSRADLATFLEVGPPIRKAVKVRTKGVTCAFPEGCRTERHLGPLGSEAFMNEHAPAAWYENRRGYWMHEGGTAGSDR